jgi:hypothetical protein
MQQQKRKTHPNPAEVMTLSESAEVRWCMSSDRPLRAAAVRMGIASITAAVVALLAVLSLQSWSTG